MRAGLRDRLSVRMTSKRRRVMGLFFGVASGVMGFAAVALGIGQQPSSRRVVPRLAQQDVGQAYRLLHGDGFRVSIPGGIFLDSLEAPVGYVIAVSPAPGTRLRRGASVTLRVGCRCKGGSPAVPRHLPRYRVPNFRRRLVSGVQQWLRDKVLYERAHLGPLNGGKAPTLYENYRVTRQRPAPGAWLQLGHGTGQGSSGEFGPTPLEFWAKQTTRSGGHVHRTGAPSPSPSRHLGRR